MSDELKRELSREEKLAELAATVAEYESQAADYQDAANQLKKTIKELMGDYGMLEAGNFKVTYNRPKRQFDKESFAAAHPFNKEPQYYEVSVSMKAIPQNIKDTYMVPGNGEGTVSVK